MGSNAATPSDGLNLAPFRGLRHTVGSDRLGRLLCPPYDVIDPVTRDRLLRQDAENVVSVVLPEPAGVATTYQAARRTLDSWISSGLLAVDERAAIYVYDMRTPEGISTRGLLGAVELRDPADGVILPHEDTMAGPIADRLALMTATQANLEPIYLVYDGGGAASDAVESVDDLPPHSSAITADGNTHRLWALTDGAVHAEIATDLTDRRALIADGHHRYATYRELQQRQRAAGGPGPWDRGLTLLVDTLRYGPQVHAIHRVLPRLPIAEAFQRAEKFASLTPVDGPEAGLEKISSINAFAVVLSDGNSSYALTNLADNIAASAPDEPAELAGLDVTRLHRGLVTAVWQRMDDPESVQYAHSVSEALEQARTTGGTAVLMRPTPVHAVAAIAAAGARMPRKSTLFTPKPASGMVMRRFADE